MRAHPFNCRGWRARTSRRPLCTPKCAVVLVVFDPICVCDSGAGAQIFRPDFDFSQLQIGGLDAEFSDIFRRAFASRMFPTSVVRAMGIHHVRGMLLYGPPGCGKTLIARQIGKVLNARPPKVCAPPLLPLPLLPLPLSPHAPPGAHSCARL